MHATVRNYSGKGSKELIDLLDKRKDEVKGLLTSIKGFVSYSLRQAGAPDRVSRGDGSSHRPARDRNRSLNRVSGTCAALAVPGDD